MRFLSAWRQSRLFTQMKPITHDQSSEHHESDHKDHGHHDEDEHYYESDHKDHGAP